MASAMAPPSARARMRLTIEVLPLTPDNANGPYRSHALASLKGRKFALPVSTDDTFEAVWTQIEHRYRTNYLSTQQAAHFTIKKLQDAYDCDLFMTDTVGSIFEGETDPTLRRIKVVPAFLDRGFSMPPTTGLRPAHVHKRVREPHQDTASKRRRTGQSAEPGIDLETLGPVRDRPVLSTENSSHGQRSRSRSRSHHQRSRSRASRCTTEASLVLVEGTQTGQAEFAPAVKQESPELRSPPTTQHEHALPQANGQTQTAHPGQETPERTTQVSSIRHSLPPTSAQRRHTSPRVVVKRRDVYDVPSSPEFLHSEPRRTNVTYARNATTSRSARALGLRDSSQLQTPLKPISSPPARPGSLKKPSRNLIPDVNKQSAETRATAPRRSVGRPGKSFVAEASADLATTASAVNTQPSEANTPAESFIQRFNASETIHGPDTVAGDGGLPSDTPGSAHCDENMAPGDAAAQGADVGSNSPHPRDNMSSTNLSHTPTSHVSKAQSFTGHRDHGEARRTNSPQVQAPHMLETGESTAAVAPWNDHAWDFATLNKHGTAAKASNKMQSDTPQRDSSQALARDGEIRGHELQSKAPAANACSRSVSASVSTRSSPELLRQPARYLSHSPSSTGSASERVSEEPSAVRPALGEEPAASSDSSSGDDQSDTEEESDTGDQRNGLGSASPGQLASSPPTIQNAPPPKPSLPSVSQPVLSRQVQHTPIPLPSNITRSGGRPSAARYTGFPSLREQLVDVKTPSKPSHVKPYDPRLANFAKLAAAPGTLPTSADESSDEDSTSSDSD